MAKPSYDELFQMYVDANEARLDAIKALEDVRKSKMPGESRAIAIRALRLLGKREMTYAM